MHITNRDINPGFVGAVHCYMAFSPGAFAAPRALSVEPRGFPSIPFVCLLPLLAALNGMPQRPRNTVMAAWTRYGACDCGCPWTWSVP